VADDAEDLDGHDEGLAAPAADLDGATFCDRRWTGA
jgi:hypothetical protein